MESYGVIIQQLRKLANLSVQQAAQKIGRSKGWLSEIETASGRCRLTEQEFNRIVDVLDGSKHRPLFKTWAANSKNRQKSAKVFDGAVLKYIRLKKGFGLLKASQVTGLSIGYISKMESGSKPVSFEMRNKIMIGYGYSPTSFKNLATDPSRSKAVPSIYKLRIILRELSDSNIAAVLQFASELIETNSISTLSGKESL